MSTSCPVHGQMGVWFLATLFNVSWSQIWENLESGSVWSNPMWWWCSFPRDGCLHVHVNPQTHCSPQYYHTTVPKPMAQLHSLQNHWMYYITSSRREGLATAACGVVTSVCRQCLFKMVLTHTIQIITLAKISLVVSKIQTSVTKLRMRQSLAFCVLVMQYILHNYF